MKDMTTTFHRCNAYLSPVQVVYYSAVWSMLTGKSDAELNVPSEDSHFLTHNSLGQKYKIPSKSSFIVKAKLLKLERWDRSESLENYIHLE